MRAKISKLSKSPSLLWVIAVAGFGSFVSMMLDFTVIGGILAIMTFGALWLSELGGES